MFAKVTVKPRRTLFLAAFFWGAALGAGSATAAEVNCPLSQIRREVVTPLPPGWWQTPIINRLTDTRIITFGDGSKALQCIYGESGSIMRRPPRGQRCDARRGGFTCRPANRATPAPGIYSQGRTTLSQTYTIDLDRLSRERNDADLWFQAETRDRMYLVPWNGARIALGDLRANSYASCRDARYTSSRVSLRDLRPGARFCVRTNQGLYSLVRIQNISRGIPRQLRLQYTTWR